MLASHNFAKGFEVRRAINAVAAGTTAQNGNAIDMQGFRGCAFVVSFGALTATQVTSIKVQQSDASGSGFEDLADSQTAALADADGNKELLVEVYEPKKRYLRVVVNRGTANAVINGGLAILTRGETLPPALGSLASAAVVLNAPAEGTA